MNRKQALFGLILVAALALAACAPAAQETPTNVPEPTVMATEPIPETGDEEAGMEANVHDNALVEVSENDELGSFLVDGQGMTLYLFTNDEPGVSNCSGDCLVNWPPLLTRGEPEAGEGVDASKLGTIPYEDDLMLVTYDGWPLYYWVNDMAPGDTTGQGVGDVWFVVDPAGVMMDDSSDDSSSMDSVSLEVSESDELGSFLVDGEGMTLYMFTNDEPGVSNCSGQCLENWPPFLTSGEVEAGEGVDDSKIDTIPFEGDQMLVTYDGYPLYYWANDTAPGDTTGQGVGDVWFVVSPDGVMMDDSSSMDAVQLEMAESDELGSFLVDSEGMTLYMFTNDEPGVSNCSGQCLENWPPFLTTGEVEAGEGVDDSKIDTIPFEGDQMLVTYDGYPLYYWVNDQEPGDTTGQGVGDVWFVVSPDGVMIDDTSMTDPSY